jgi:signal transduction histidine kinase
VQVRLIEDLLDMGRILSGTFRLDLQPLDLGALVAASVESLRPTAELKGVRLETELDPDVDGVTGDPSRLQQVVVNLLSNAIKFTPEGGEARVSVARSGGRVEIRVSDTGVGIEEDFLPYVFERFRQEDGSTTRRYGGLGLGLSIVKHLVELHGGTIRAESGGRDQGAAFTVSLPLASEKKKGDPQVPPLQTAGPGKAGQNGQRG